MVMTVLVATLVSATASLSQVLMQRLIHADAAVGLGGGTPGTAANFTLVGHNPLFDRGMNAALAIFDHYVYVGNRTDGSSTCGIGDPRRDVDLNSCPQPHPGILKG